MRSLPLAATLAATAVTAGAALLGASLGGMAHVDAELKAASSAPAVHFDRVLYTPRAAEREDCPGQFRHRSTTTRPEL